MGDVVKILEKSKEAIQVLMGDQHLKNLLHLDELMKEIDEAIACPEIHISVPNGKLVAFGQSSFASDVAGILFYNDDLESVGPIDLVLAEHNKVACRNGTRVEGDIDLYAWEDPSREDYTAAACIRADEMDKAIAERVASATKEEKDV